MSILKQIGIQRWRLRSSRQRTAEDIVVTQTSAQNIKSAAAALPDDPDADVTPLSSDQPDSEPANTQIAAPPVKLKLSSTGNNSGLDQHSWQNLAMLLETGSICESCKNNNSLLGAGDLKADWVFVVDAPSTRDVQTQQLLCGRAGLLFDAILQSLGLSRDGVYLTSVFKCPPSETQRIKPQCGSLVHRQISLIQPKVVLTLGEFTSQSVLRANDNLDRLRAGSHALLNNEVSVVATYSLDQLLENPALKAQVWQDLNKCLKVL